MRLGMAKREYRRAKDRKIHYTYLIRDIKNQKVYYGVHSTDYDPRSIEDYHSSSKHLNLIIKEEGFSNFTKEVRRIFTCRKDADSWEAKVLKKINAKDHNHFYNKSNGGEGFTASGYISVRLVDKDCCIRVPVDDPYIGILYNHVSLGRKMPLSEKANLSSYYKGKRSGKDNPVHKIKDKESWVRKISEGNTGKKRTEEVVSNLKNPAHWKHLSDVSISTSIRENMNFMRTINNNRYLGFWIYKGVIYLYKESLPVSGEKNCSVTYIKEPHPEVNTLQTDFGRFPSIKLAAKSLGCHINSINNRITSESSAWVGYFWLSREEVLANKKEMEVSFLKYIKDKYSEEITENANYKKPLSVGEDDQNLTKSCMLTGAFLEGSTFKRSYERDSQGYYSSVDFTCPLCSDDTYVKQGVCDGIFSTSRIRIKQGKLPCRCGGIIPEEVYEYEVRKLCDKEEISFIGWKEDTYIGVKETKIVYSCRKGNIHSNTRIQGFLKGSRCRCCNSENKNLSIPMINLSEGFKFRKEIYKESLNESN